jgi:hypothetical protein
VIDLKARKASLARIVRTFRLSRQAVASILNATQDQQ